MFKTYKGKFTPQNPSKYMGNASNIIYRSSWELKMFTRLDADPNIVQWASEEFHVPYFNPIDQKVHRYFPDVYFENTNGDRVVIEIKPDKQTRPPAKRSRQTPKYISEASTYVVNRAKWDAAEKFCKDRGWQFVIATEKDLY